MKKQKYRISFTLSLLFFCLLFSSCKKENGASEKAISNGKAVIEIADDYLDKEIDAGVAREKIQAIYEDMSYVETMDKNDENYSADFYISTDILLIDSSILNDSIKTNAERYDAIVDARNSLADKTGIKKR